MRKIIVKVDKEKATELERVNFELKTLYRELLNHIQAI